MITAMSTEDSVGRQTQTISIARESLIAVRDVIQGVQVSAPFGNVKYALQVFDVLSESRHRRDVSGRRGLSD